MKNRFRAHLQRALAASLILLTAQFAVAADTAPLRGSYQVLGQTSAGPQTRVRLRLRLTNSGSGDLRIQSLTLRDSAHAGPGATQKSAFIIHGGASTDTVQEFTISRSEFELWRRGTRPRLVLELLHASGRTATEVVRLDRDSRGKAN